MIQAQETYYKDICFRSRLEANWAEYFDFIGVEWAYETEHYRLSNGALYLPDFYLRELDVFVECRGNLSRSLRKPALFLKDTHARLLVALAEGRFFLATLNDEETGGPYSGFLNALFEGRESDFTYFQKKLSCFVELAEDAAGSPRKYFANYGFSSDIYCGSHPDWFDSIKDRSRVGDPFGDARSYYWGGYSTWEQRGFSRSRYLPNRC